MTGESPADGQSAAENERTNEAGSERSGLLRRLLPFGAAFLAGFLLGRRSGMDDEWAEVVVEDSDRARERGEMRAANETSAATTGAETVESGESEESEASAESAKSNESAEDAARAAPERNGMPMLGIGTYEMDDDECAESVRRAIEMGYRHVDTAEMYDNEGAVGEAIARADVPREDLFVATKVSPENLGYDDVLSSAEESLDELGLDYVDLLYVHWPAREYDPEETLDAFAELQDEWLVREIGVSNFTVELLEEAIEVAEEPIFANQVEMHPLLQQDDLRAFRDGEDVELVAYSPIVKGDADDADELREIAAKHDATATQVCLAWLREQGVTAIPKATSEDHIRENWESLDLELDEEDVAKIESIDREERIVDPDIGPWNESGPQEASGEAAEAGEENEARDGTEAEE